MGEDKVEAQMQDWSEEDRVWLSKVPKELKPIAQRHGRAMFQVVMYSGAVNHGFAVVGKIGGGDPRIAKAMGVMGKGFEFITLQAIEGLGGIERFKECKEDVERMLELAAQTRPLPGERISKGGIILDS